MRANWSVFVLTLWFRGYVAGGQAPAGPQLIRDVRLSMASMCLNTGVLIQNSVIAEIAGPELEAANADVIDGRGRTLLPGLIDAHVHIPDQAEEASRQALTLGVTTQLDMFSAGERLKRIKTIESEDRPDLADVRTAGIGATVP